MQICRKTLLLMVWFYSLSGYLMAGPSDPVAKLGIKNLGTTTFHFCADGNPNNIWSRIETHDGGRSGDGRVMKSTDYFMTPQSCAGAGGRFYELRPASYMEIDRPKHTLVASIVDNPGANQISGTGLCNMSPNIAALSNYCRFESSPNSRRSFAYDEIVIHGVWVFPLPVIAHAFRGHGQANRNIRSEDLKDLEAVPSGSAKFRWVSFREARTGKCLNMHAGSPQNGSKVNLWQCASNNNQRWMYEPDTGFIRNAINPDYCLDMPGNDNDDSELRMWRCTKQNGVAHPNQRFIVDGVTIKSHRNPNQVIDAAGEDNDANIVMYHNNQQPNQDWVPIMLPVNGHTTRATHLVNPKSKMCLGLANESGQNSTHVKLVNCQGKKSQQWFYDDLDGTLRNGHFQNKCLDIPWGKHDLGNRLVIHDCHPRGRAGAVNQQFIFDGSKLVSRSQPDIVMEPVTDSAGSSIALTLQDDQSEPVWVRSIAKGDDMDWHWSSLRDSNSGRCIDIPNSNARAGTPLMLHDCHGGDNQMWAYDWEKNLFRSKLNNMCMDSLQDSFSQLAIWPCDQRRDGQRYLRRGLNIRLMKDMSQAVDAAGSVNGTDITLYGHHNHYNQRWMEYLP